MYWRVSSRAISEFCGWGQPPRSPAATTISRYAFSSVAVFLFCSKSDTREVSNRSPS